MINLKTLKIADLFCGAGGTSTGAVEAIESLGYRAELTAINHWNVAIATHTENHPGARHLCTSLDNINPRDLFPEAEGGLDILWASPECTHHSVARGGKPINDQSRSTAWCVVRWAEALRPNIILVENVPEFATWGPIGTNNRPLKTRKGELFNAWKAAIEACGYKVDHRVLVAADYGDPTTRRRLFVMCVRGKRKVVFPDATHSRAVETDLFGQRRRAWKTARTDVIDWSIKGQSIYDRKRPLSPKTMRRIMAGLEKFGLKPFIVPQQTNPTPKGVDEPLPTVVAEGSGAKLVHPFIITMEHGGAVRSADRPLPTVTCAKGGAMALAEPFLIPQHGSNGPRSIDGPAPTVTTTSRGMGLAEPFLVKLRGTNNAADVDQPAPTVTASGTHLGLAEPLLSSVGPGGPGNPMLNAAWDKIVKRSSGLSAALLPQGGGGAMRGVSEPAPTIHCDGAVALVEPFLVEYYGNGKAESVNDPLNTVTCKERHALVRPEVVIQGERYFLDIRFRMLQPHELAAAQGFRRDYKFKGNKTEQVKQIGNAVPRRTARALCLAALSQQSDITPFLNEDNFNE